MIPFSPPYITQEVIDEVVDTLKSGWITTGPKTKLFEKLISEYCGNEKTLCVNSATFGLELILRWFGVGEGDEVIVPAYTYTATASVVLHTGATPVMVDVNENDFNINIENTIKKINSKTKVIIPVDFAGFPAETHILKELVQEENIRKLFIPKNEIQEKLGRILILSDSAHSFGAIMNNKKVGTIADITVFSFHAVKNLTTAEGGAISLNLPKPFDNEEVYKLLNILSLHGQNKDALAKTQLGGWKYDIIEPAYKGNMTDIQAAMGIAALKRYDSFTLPKRKHIFDFYSNYFSQFSWAQIPIYKDNYRKSSYHVYALRIKGINEEQRNQIINKIFEKQVAVNVHFQPLPLLTAYKKLGYKIEDYPISYNNYQREISLPVYEALTDENLQTIVNAVTKSVNEVI